MLIPSDIIHVWGSVYKEVAYSSVVGEFTNTTDRLLKKTWSAVEGYSCELEFGDFLWGLVRYLKPDVIVETGTYRGFTASCMAIAVRENNNGHIWTIDNDVFILAEASSKFEMLDLSSFITIIHADSLSDDLVKLLSNNEIDLLLIDGGDRKAEYEKYSKFVSKTGLCLWHDALKFDSLYDAVKSYGGKIIYAGRGVGII